MASSTPPPLPPQQQLQQPQFHFEFVPGLDRSYGGRKRALVLRKHFANVKKAAAAGASGKGPGCAGAVANGRDGRTVNGGAGEKSESSTNGSVSGSELQQRQSQSPRLSLTVTDDSSGYDPFDSMALSCDSQGQLLNKHSLDMAASYFGLVGNSRLNPMLLFFAEAVHEAAVMHVIHTKAAYHLAVVKAKQFPAEEAHRHRIRLLRLIRDNLSDPSTAYSDAAIHGIMGLISTDVEILRKRQNSEMQAHTRGLCQVILGRGGPRNLGPVLQWLYYWQDITCGGDMAAAMAELQASQHCIESNQKQMDKFFASPVRETILPAARVSPRFFDVLLSVYTSAYDAAKARCKHQRSSAVTNGEAFYQPFGSFFAPGTNFYNVLSRKTPYSRLAHIASLVYVNLIVLECQFNAMALAKQLYRTKALSHLLTTGSGSCVGLLGYLMTEESALRLDDLDKAELVTHFLYAYKQMTWMTQSRIDASLMGILLADVQGMDGIYRPDQVCKLL